MDITFGDIQETALIPLAIKASETARPNPRIRDEKAKAIIDALGVDVSKYDPFLSHEGVVARTIMFRDTLKGLLKVDKDVWTKEVEEIEVHFRKFGDKLPHELRDQLETLRKGIADMKD